MAHAPAGDALPSESQLALPLLRELAAAGGRARPGELYDRIAATLGISDAARSATVVTNGRKTNAYQRRVRWVRQTLVARELIANDERGVWALTDRGNAKLQNIIAGVIVTVFTTANGAFVWANASDTTALVERGSVDLLLCSPPYPLLTPKPYSLYEKRDVDTWLEMMLRLVEGWTELLAPTGSIMLQLGPCFERGMPAESLFAERLLVRLEDSLGVRLCQRLATYTASRMGPLAWCGIRRVRVRPAVDQVLWLSPRPEQAHANVDHVLVPYSKSGLRSIANPEDGTRKRPSGFVFGPRSFRQHPGGAIPTSLIKTNPMSGGARAYHRAERAAGRVPHPAPMPEDLARFAIALTTDEDFLVYDPMAGSGVVPLVAEQMGRRWLAGDRSREYIRSAQIRFASAGRPIELHHAA
jgi:hypothetical protein